LVIEVIEKSELDDLQYYWNDEDFTVYDDRIEKWCEIVLKYSQKSFPSGREFLVHLIADRLHKRTPFSIQEECKKFGIS
jgi:hypothetical protein